MITQYIKIVNIITKTKTYLLAGNIVLVLALIILNNLKVLPLDFGDFLFFAFLTLAVALYRPGWCFLFFIGTLPLEIVNLAPIQIGINVRPYQFIGAIIILALAIRLITKRLSFKLIKPKWFDWLVIIFAISGFLSIIGASDKIVSLKLSVIIGTFALLYFLVRNYIQDSEDLKRIIPFFLSTSIIVVFYGIWQNWRFLHNLSNFEAMPGRPNATFTEADWLGMFLVLLTGVVYILIYKNISDAGAIYELPQERAVRKPPLHRGILYLVLIVVLILLILTVSRSAWLGAFVVYVIFILTFFTDLHLRNWKWRQTSWLKLKIISSLIVAVLIVYIFHLTNFQLFNRVQSTGTGLQKITISCQGDATKLPEKISNVEELKQYNCRHINLEDIEKERQSNNIVTEIYRDDPNVNIRGEIYRKSWAQIKSHPILGIGWGSISQILGTDGRGTPLNSSNIFLEAWLGAGIIGFLALVVFLGYILVKSVRNYYRAQNDVQKAVSLFILISWFGMIITNLFNAGIFLAFFWVWLAIVEIKE